MSEVKGQADWSLHINISSVGKWQNILSRGKSFKFVQYLFFMYPRTFAHNDLAFQPFTLENVSFYLCV